MSSTYISLRAVFSDRITPTTCTHGTRKPKQTIEERDSDAYFTRSDTAAYLLENFVASDGNGVFKLLIGITAVILVIMGFIWTIIENLGHTIDDPDDPGALKSDPRPPLDNLKENWFNAFQILATGGYDDTIGLNMSSDVFRILDRLVYVILLAAGLIVFAILVGIITSMFEGLMTSIEEGKTKVAEKNHTLILGWNESTVRVVCQIAFLRRAWRIQNERWDRKYFPWNRVPPSSPVAKYPIVVMSNNGEMTKADMDEQLGNALAERGISPKRTKIGWDVVCRVGDPTSVHDLVRVNAKAAKSIMLMMTDQDEDEFVKCQKQIENGATIRTMLALRSVLCASQEDMDRFDDNDIRIVVELQKASPFVSAACFRSTGKKKLIETMDLTVFVNTLMFLCAAKPNLSQVVTSVMNFEDAAMRCRRMDQIKAGPENKLGWLIGKTFEDAYKKNCWAKSVLIGVTNVKVLYDSRGMLRGDKGEIIGVCPQSDYEIQADDLAMFLSPVSMPRVSDNHEDRNLAKTASTLADLDVGVFTDEQINANQKRQQRLLVCGWREAWSTNPARLKARIFDVCKSASPDSYIVFLNQTSTEGFATLLDKAGVCTKLAEGALLQPGCSSGYSVTEFQNVNIFHCCGDAGSFEAVEPLFRTPDVFETAIVLGTQAGKDLPPASQDTRVLSILLLLRKLTEDWTKKMSVISENMLDQTANVAVTPGGAYKDPDFVNTQAISARGLTMALAYPRMQPAVNELFQDVNADDGTPEFDLISAQFLGIGTFVLWSHFNFYVPQ